jgi:hypothetical protein
MDGLDWALTTTVMIVDTCIETSAVEREPLGIPGALHIIQLPGQAEIDSVKYVSLLSETHEKILWLDIAMEDALRMNILDSRNGLVGDEEDSLKRESPAAIVE